jgi:hypothetical protein
LPNYSFQIERFPTKQSEVFLSAISCLLYSLHSSKHQMLL